MLSYSVTFTLFGGGVCKYWVKCYSFSVAVAFGMVKLVADGYSEADVYQVSVSFR